MAHLISAADLENLESVADLRTWVSLVPAAWEAVNTMLGTAPHLRVLAFMPAAAVREAVGTARVPVPPVGVAGEDGYVAATTRALTAVECTQVALMFQIAQLKLGRTPDQISAMKARVLQLDVAPYADFGIFVSHQRR